MKATNHVSKYCEVVPGLVHKVDIKCAVDKSRLWEQCLKLFRQCKICSSKIQMVGHFDKTIKNCHTGTPPNKDKDTERSTILNEQNEPLNKVRPCSEVHLPSNVYNWGQIIYRGKMLLRSAKVYLYCYNTSLL